MLCPNCHDNNTVELNSVQYSCYKRYRCLSCSREFTDYSINLVKCPDCNNETCYYIGFSANNIECMNTFCKYYKEYTSSNRYKYSMDEDYTKTLKNEKIEKEKKEKEEKERINSEDDLTEAETKDLLDDII